MRFYVVLLVACLVPRAAAAQDVAFERLSDLLNAGDHVQVVDAAGREHSGRVVELTADTIAVTHGNAVERLARPEVREVWTRRRDPVSNGALIGFAVVAGTYCGFAVSWDRPGLCGFPAVFFGGFGAGIGALLDAAVTGHVRVFHATPVALHVTPGRDGVVVGALLRW